METVHSKRSLYQCFNAKVCDHVVMCVKGHKLGRGIFPQVGTYMVALGKPLEVLACQDCPDFDKMGEPLKKNERGWIKNATNNN